MIPIGFSCANILSPKDTSRLVTDVYKGLVQIFNKGIHFTAWMQHSLPTPTSADRSLQNEASA